MKSKHFDYLRNKKMFELYSYTGGEASFIEDGMKNLITASVETLIQTGITKPDLAFFVINDNENIDDPKSPRICKVFITHNPKIDSDFVKQTILFVLIFFSAAIFKKGKDDIESIEYDTGEQ